MFVKFEIQEIAHLLRCYLEAQTVSMKQRQKYDYVITDKEHKKKETYITVCSLVRGGQKSGLSVKTLYIPNHQYYLHYLMCWPSVLRDCPLYRLQTSRGSHRGDRGRYRAC